VRHQDTYSKNESYARILEGWDPAFYALYIDTLCPDEPGARALEVGCGVGRVVEALQSRGYEAVGVEVSEPNLQLARQRGARCELYDGAHLPFPDGAFASVGALNVLEHVEEPERFLEELVRVTSIQGKVVVSSPNFYRVIGFRDYHPRMRGLGNKWRNCRRLLQKWRQISHSPDEVRFDRMEPIVREEFQPDDDAIIATNALEMGFFLERASCEVERVSCTDRHVNRALDFLLNAGPWRYAMLNSFLVARRVR
jgi:SAM-dependent methyltransferase